MNTGASERTQLPTFTKLITDFHYASESLDVHHCFVTLACLPTSVEVEPSILLLVMSIAL